MAADPDFDVSATAPLEGPWLKWCALSDVRAACGLDETEVDDDTVEWAIALASKILWAASGRRYGTTGRTVRPCYEGDHAFGFHGRSDNRHDDLDVHVHSYSGYTCTCSLPELKLPGPIAAVEEIIYNGTVLDPSAYAIKTYGHQARRVLLRLDGESWWCCNDLTASPQTVAESDDSCPAWEVTYHQGRMVPLEAVGIATAFAEQLARARCGGRCAENVSAGVTKIARRGTTREYEAPAAAQALGVMSDLPSYARDWLTAVNPSRLPRRTQIISATDANRRRLWSWV